MAGLLYVGMDTCMDDIVGDVVDELVMGKNG